MDQNLSVKVLKVIYSLEEYYYICHKHPTLYFTENVSSFFSP